MIKRHALKTIAACAALAASLA
ncbi:MAG: hypothetical protein RIS88_835, partial [Pseudomonadota bacterium]